MATSRPDPKKIKEAQETVKKFLNQLKQSTENASKSIEQAIKKETQITQLGQAVIKRGSTIKDDDD